MCAATKNAIKQSHSVTTNQYPFRNKFIRLNMQPAKACPILAVPIAKNRILMPDFIDLKVIVEPSLAGTITSLVPFKQS